MKYKYQTGSTVWVVMFSETKFGVVVKAYEDKEKPVYDVRIVDAGTDPVKVAMGGGPACVELCGWSEWRVHETDLGAAREVYRQYAEKHHSLGLALQDCIAHFDDPDYITCRLKAEDAG